MAQTTPQSFGKIPKPLGFRDYDNTDHDSQVRRTYKNMHQNQSHDFVVKMHRHYLRFQTTQMTIWQACQQLSTIIDESDPDNDLPQIIHAYQSGEYLRHHLLDSDQKLKPLEISELFSPNHWQALPEEVRQIYETKSLADLYQHIEDWSWLPLVGFIHDLGKVLALPQWAYEGQTLEQWAIVGDTFPIACRFDPANIYYEHGYYQDNPDYQKPDFQSLHGIYEPQAGLQNLIMSWGHDEYLAAVCSHNTSKLPPEAIYLIRFHSFYPWHSPRQNQGPGYSHLAAWQDWQMLPLLKGFQKSDLYSKSRQLPDVPALEAYYQQLIHQYFSSKPLAW